MAGVSKSTVSRVHQRHPQRHARGASRGSAGDRPHRLHSPTAPPAAWSAGRTSSIAPGGLRRRTRGFFSDPYFARVIRAPATLVPADWAFTWLLMLAGTGGQELLAYLRHGHVDGVLFVSTQRRPLARASWSREAAAVFGGRPMSAGGWRPATSTSTTWPAAGRRYGQLVAARPAPDRDDRRARRTWRPGSDRLARLAARRWPRPGWPRGLVEYGRLRPASGARATAGLLATGEPFDGLFVASAQMAWARWRCCASTGCGCPRDVAWSVVDDSSRQPARPPLTTVRQPTLELGRTMADVLIDVVEGRPVERVTILADRGGVARLGVSPAARGPPTGGLYRVRMTPHHLPRSTP